MSNPSASMDGVLQLVGGLFMGGLALYNLTQSTPGTTNNSSQSTNANSVSVAPPPPLNISVADSKKESSPAKKIELNGNGVNHHHHETTNNGHHHSDDDAEPTWKSKIQPQLSTDEIKDVFQVTNHVQVLRQEEEPEEKDDVPSWMSKVEVTVRPSELNNILAREWQSESTKMKSIHEEEIEKMEHIPDNKGEKLPDLTLSPVRAPTSYDVEITRDMEPPSWMSRIEPHTTVEEISEFPLAPANSAASIQRLDLNLSGTRLCTANEVLSHVTVQLSDTVFVYPVLSSSYLGESIVSSKKHDKLRNALNKQVEVKKMETRAGAGSVVVGTLTAGLRAAVLTSSSALKLMIPTLHQISSLHVPVVFHLTSGSISSDDLSLRSDHTDVYLTRDTGFAIICSSSAQEAQDMALVSHIASSHSDTPFIHFFDAARALNSLTEIRGISDSSISKIVREDHHVLKGSFLSQQPKCTKINVANVVSECFNHLSSTVFQGRKYKVFEYTGPSDAEIIIVCMGSPASVLERMISSYQEQQAERKKLGLRHQGGSENDKLFKVGIVKVRLLRPWSPELLLEMIPKTTRRVCVLDQTSSNRLAPLFQDVSAAFHTSTRWVTPLLIGGRIQPSTHGLTLEMARVLIENMRSDAPQPNFLLSCDPNVSTLPVSLPTSMTVHDSTLLIDNRTKQIVCWEGMFQTKASESASQVVAKALHSSLGVHVQQTVGIDQFVVSAGESGVRRTELLFGPSLIPAEYSPTDAGSADVIVFDDISVLKAEASNNNGIEMFSALRDGGIMIVGVTPSGKETDISHYVQSNITPSLKRKIARKSVKLFFFNSVEASKIFGASVDISREWIAILLALHSVSPSAYSQIIGPVANGFRHALIQHGIIGSTSSSTLAIHHVDRLPVTHFHQIQYGYEWLETNAAESRFGMNNPNSHRTPFTPRIPFETCSDKNHTKGDETLKEVSVSQKYRAAWSLIFREAFETRTALRPREHEVHQVKLTSRKRLTPESYDRNIFHLELDASGTNLRYQIGDALGVFGHNDEKEIDHFIHEYGLNPDEFVSRKMDDDPSRSELISVRNMLIQHLDIFGRPTKKFYVALAAYAKGKSTYDHLWLMHIGTDDAEEFKLCLSETVTYADVLLRFRGAHPPLEDLVKMIPPIKPRHYSIASSMKLNPRSVHLLIVAVDWKTPKGRDRYGQCTRYLANLQTEQESGKDVYLTVDIKPSVLRLPPSPKQPIIMAGLGTGMAPFRAFIQERQIQKEMGIEVGPIVLYFGARHRDQEYLYGDELDQYFEQGLVSKLGLAFSRDQKSKVYIQDKIAEDADILRQYFNEDNGHFYLCGPTWPVPSVRDAIAKGLNPVSASVGIIDTERVEKLKEEGRYVLEVY